MRVLVTGGGGHVGGAVVRRLTDEGHEVLAPARSVVDIADRAAVERIAGEPPCDAIVHAAAALGLDPFDPAISRVNCLGTQHVLWLAERWGCERFVFTSSIQVVGRPLAAPLGEDHGVAPLTAYHASKLFGEHLVAQAAGRGVLASSLRLTSPVGPGTAGGRIFSVFAERARAGLPLEVAGAGTRRQDYVDVRDVADAVALAFERGLTGVCNVGSGRAVSNRALAERCVAALGSDSEIRLGGAPDPEEGVAWEVSIERAATALGYAPRRSLEDSIRDFTAAARPR